MEYLYGMELTGLIDRATVQRFREELPGILRKKFGPDWYKAYADPVMNKYPDYGKMFIPEMNPLSSYDISALWFLMFPYDAEDADDDTQQMTGAGKYFAEDRGLTDEDLNLIAGLRSLRNSLVHKNVRMRFITPPHRSSFEMLEQTRVVNGKEKTIRIVNYTGPDTMEGQRIIHEDAFDYIAKAAGKLNPQASLIIAETRTDVMNKLREGKTGGPDTVGSSDPESDRRYARYIGIIEGMRQEYSFIKDIDWIKVPVGRPLDMPAPWIETNDDLDSLPWPDTAPLSSSQAASSSGASQSGPAQTVSAPAGYGPGTSGEDLLRNTLKDAANDAKNIARLGADLLGGFFGKRK